MTIPRLAVSVLILLAPPPAAAERSDWTEIDNARLRLLAVRQADGGVSAGVEIELAPAWYTYWRNPGEAGVPPQFDFGGSDNVETVAVHYPVPERHDDGVSVSVIYRDQVVFPLTVRPGDAGAPVRLTLDASFGVCSTVCIPSRASAEVTVPAAAAADPLSEAKIAQYRARLPGAPQPGRFEIAAVAVADAALTIDVLAPAGTPADLFADGPEGWYLGQPEFAARQGGLLRYRLSLAGRPPDAAASGQAFRFLAVAGGEAIEQTLVVP